jgi:hypothetical protein
MLPKPKNTISRSNKLRRPKTALSNRRAVVVSRNIELSVDLGAKLLRLFLDKKPNPDKYEARPFVTKGMTVDRLLAKTRPQQIELSQNVVIKNVRFRHHKKSLNPVILCETYSKKTGKGASGYDKYVTYIEALHSKKGAKFSQTFVKVGCSCPFFTFFAEVALAKHGAADVFFSNGDPPVVRNPKERPLLCKHLVKLVGRVKDKGK